MKPEWIKDYTCIFNQVIHSNSKHEFILTLFNKRTYMIVHVCAFFSSLNVNYTCIFIICKSMSVCHHTLFAFLSAIHSNVQNCSFLYFNCIRIIYAHSMFFFLNEINCFTCFGNAFIAIFIHHTLNTWVAYFVFNSVVLWIHIFYNLCQSAKKECNNFFFKMPSEVLNLADKQSFTWSWIYMFIKHNVKCLSAWLVSTNLIFYFTKYCKVLIHVQVQCISIFNCEINNPWSVLSI